jgi:hypothetical protein
MKKARITSGLFNFHIITVKIDDHSDASHPEIDARCWAPATVAKGY